MKTRTLSAIRSEANYLRARLIRTEHDRLPCTARFLEMQGLRAALARLDVELGAQSQTNIETCDGAVDFSLL